MILKTPVVIDTSHYNDCDFLPPRYILSAVICKASEGATLTDDKFASSWAQLGQLGIPRAAYHFYRKAYSLRELIRRFVFHPIRKLLFGAATFTSNADKFISVIRASGGLVPGDKIVLDAEESGMSIGALVNCAYNMEIVLGVKPILYSRANILNALSFTKLTQFQKDYVKSLDIWTAGYPFDPDDWNTVPPDYVPDPARYGRVVIWQYGSAYHGIPGIAGDIDVDWIEPAYMADWAASYTGITPPPEPPPNGGNLIAQFNCKVTSSNGVKVRHDPSTSNTNTGTFKFGDTFQASEIVPDRVFPTDSTKLWAHIFGGKFDGQYCAVLYNGVICVYTPIATPPPPPPETNTKVVDVVLTESDNDGNVTGVWRATDIPLIKE